MIEEQERNNAIEKIRVEEYQRLATTIEKLNNSFAIGVAKLKRSALTQMQEMKMDLARCVSKIKTKCQENIINKSESLIDLTIPKRDAELLSILKSPLAKTRGLSQTKRPLLDVRNIATLSLSKIEMNRENIQKLKEKFKKL